MNNNFKETVSKRPGGENIKVCFSCGTCTAGCPISEINKDFNPRVYIKKVLLGLEEEVLKDDNIWMCIQCHRCVAHCPQNVKFADILRVLRELAVEKGYYSAQTASDIELLDSETIKNRMENARKYLAGDKKMDEILGR